MPVIVLKTSFSVHAYRSLGVKYRMMSIYPVFFRLQPTRICRRTRGSSAIAGEDELC
jgi:hypothetical protein